MKKLPIILLLSLFTNSIQAQPISDIDEIIRLCRDTYLNCKTYQDKATRVSTVYDSHYGDTQTIVRFETYYDREKDKFKFVNTVVKRYGMIFPAIRFRKKAWKLYQKE